MVTLSELKRKYSGQAIPEWELIKAGLKQEPGKLEDIIGLTDVMRGQSVKRSPGRPRKIVIDADSEPNSGTGS